MNADLLTFAAGYCNGTLSADDFARLESLLLEDKESRALFRSYLGLDAALHDHGESAAANWIHIESAGPRQASRRMLGAAVIAAIGAAAAVLAFLFYRGPDRGVTFAALKQVMGDVRILGSDGQARAASADAPLSTGDTVRTRGSESSTVLAYADGTRLTLVGNTSVTCGDPRSKSVVVHQGTLAAWVQPQPPDRPMRLATPSAQVQVLGTRFQIEALAHRTDLAVSEGLVRLVRTRDGQAVEVSDGKYAIVTEKNNLLVEDIPSLSDTWDADFERGLPEGWDRGERVTEGLPRGSRGGVKAVPTEVDDIGSIYNISSSEAWLQGLFAIGKRTHIHVTFKMERPKWINLLIVTRTSDRHDPHYSGNYLFKDVPWVEAGQWRTLTVPLARFERIHRGDVPIEEVVPYKLGLFSDAPDRGLVVDRIWITADGPGEVVFQEVE